MRKNLCTVCLSLSIAGVAHAQQSFYNPSAAQPSTGTLLFRQTFEYTKFGDDPTGLNRDIEQFKTESQFAYGLAKDLTVIAFLPAYQRDADSSMPGVSSDDLHLGDAQLMFKYRFWQEDTGPIDTMRASLILGLDVPTSKAPFGNEGWDPVVGAVFTSIQGRHGLNAAARYTFNTHDRGGSPVAVDGGLEDTLLIDAGYLYRLAPDEYAADTHGAWYAVAELNGAYETNGDWEWRISPGIMYEARNWVFEMSVQLPIYEDLDHRPELDYAIGFGFRILY